MLGKCSLNNKREREQINQVGGYLPALPVEISGLGEQSAVVGWLSTHPSLQVPPISISRFRPGALLQLLLKSEPNMIQTPEGGGEGGKERLKNKSAKWGGQGRDLDLGSWKDPGAELLPPEVT